MAIEIVAKLEDFLLKFFKIISLTINQTFSKVYKKS